MAHSVVPLSYVRTALLVMIICLLIYSYVSYPFILARYGYGAMSVSPPIHRAKPFPSAKDYVSAAINDTLKWHNPLPIGKFCMRKSWNKEAAVNCDGVSGGIGNVKQQILNCVRHTMLQGMGLIIPLIELRSTEDLSDLHSGKTSFDYLFDRKLFEYRLNTACPDIIMYDTIEDAERNGVVVHHYPSTLTATIICDDPAEFAVHFGSILTYPTNIYRLAFTALFYLGRKFHVPISSNLKSSPRSTFLGIHLRTAKDAVDHGDFSAYEFQRDSYISTAYTLNLPVIYAASGNLTSVKMFADRAKYYMPQTTVTTKDDLLFESDLGEMRLLTWDQAALVDYIILERASFFAGVKESSFTWNVMMTRAAVRGGVDAVCGPKPPLAEHEVWRDPWTVIYGDFPAGVNQEVIKTWP